MRPNRLARCERPGSGGGHFRAQVSSRREVLAQGTSQVTCDILTPVALGKDVEKRVLILLLIANPLGPVSKVSSRSRTDDRFALVHGGLQSVLGPTQVGEDQRRRSIHEHR